jgi:hypothetical protein
MMKAISYWVLKKLADKYPNDKDLGGAVRILLKEHK